MPLMPFPDEDVPVQLVRLHDQWAAEFRELRAALQSLLGSAAVSIDHIGSTAVPGLPAKDCIDVQVQVASLDDSALLALRQSGYRLRTEPWNQEEPADGGPQRKLVFAPPPGGRRVNIHVRDAERPNVRRALLFREHLCSDRAAREWWAEVKMHAAAASNDLMRYGQAKLDAWPELVDRAEAWAKATGWQQSHPEAGEAWGTVTASHEEPLRLRTDSGLERVLINGRVHREVGPWTPSTHLLLEHLASVGFGAAPHTHGFDDEGREILDFIPGDDVGGGWSMIVSDEGLSRFAGLLRAYHDAVASFRPPADARWAFARGAPRVGEIICHGDFGPWNVVWRDGHPVGLLDWDYAYPGPGLEDVAYALEYAAPFRDDATVLKWHAFDRPPDRRHRIEIFANAYGLRSIDGLVDRVIARQRLTAEHVRLLAAQGLEPQLTWVRSGALDEHEARAAWSEINRELLG